MKINYQFDFLKQRQENDTWYKIDMIIDYDKSLISLYVDDLF